MEHATLPAIAAVASSIHSKALLCAKAIVDQEILRAVRLVAGATPLVCEQLSAGQDLEWHTQDLYVYGFLAAFRLT